MGLMMVVHGPLQKSIESRMDRLKTLLVAELEKTFQRRLSYDSISPSIFRNIDVRNLRVWSDSADLPLVSIRRLRVHYNIFALFAGNPEDAVREIILENGSVTIDTLADADILRRMGIVEKEEDRTLPGDEIPRIRITGRNMQIMVRSGENEIFAEKVFFQLLPEKTGYDIRLKTVLSYSNLRPGHFLEGGGAVVDARGRLSYSLDRADAAVAFSMLSTNLFDLKKQTFHISFTDQGIRMRKIQDRAPLDFSLSYNFAESIVSAEFLSSRFRPSTLVTMKDGLSYLNDWLSAVVSSRGSLTYDTVSRSIRYKADFDGSVRNDVITQETRFAGALEGTESSMEFQPVTVSGRYGTARFAGNLSLENFLPEGFLKISDLTLPGPEPISGTVQITREESGIMVSGSRIAWGGSEFHHLRSRLAFSARGIHLNARLSFDEDDRSEALIVMLLPLKTGEENLMHVRLTDAPVSGFLAPVRNFLPGNYTIPGYLQKSGLRISGAFFGETDFHELSLKVPDFMVYQETLPENRISLKGSYDSGSMDIRDWSFFWNGYYGKGRTAGKILPGGKISFESALSIIDIPYSFSGVLDPAGHLHIDGKYGVAAELVFPGGGGIQGTVALDSFPVPFLRDSMEVSGIAKVRYRNMDSWNLDTEDLRIAKFAPLPHIEAGIVLSASAGPKTVTIRKISYTDSFSELIGNARIDYELKPLRVNTELSLEGRETPENYSLELLYSNSSFSGELVFQELPAERLVARDLSGKASGRISFSGLPSDPEFRITAGLRGGTIKNDPVNLELSGGMDGRIIEITSLSGQYRGFNLREARAVYVKDGGKFNLDALLETPGTGSNTAWVIDGDLVARLAETPTFPEKILRAEIAGKLNVSTVSTAVDARFRTWSFDFRKSGNSAGIVGGPDNSFQASISETGDFTVSAKAPLPVSFEAEGRFRENNIEANINRISFHAEDFARLLDFNFIKFPQGHATGNLRISGPLRDPDFFGTVTVTQAVARLALIPDQLGPFQGNLIFREKEFTLQTTKIPVGKGAAEVSGTFQINHWVPHIFSLDIDTSISRGVRIAYNFGGVIVDGSGQGKIRIEGDPQRISVKGNVHATNAVVTLGEFKHKDNVSRSRGPALIVDLQFETGKSVEFYWPTAEFPILQTYASLGQKLALQVDGDTHDFRLVGDIQLRGGEIFYFDRRFFIREGSIRFNERQGSFDPFLSVRAEIRESTVAGLTRIYLVADNTRLSQFSPRFESDGGLTDLEIMAILGRNVFGGGASESIGLSTALLFSSDILTQIGVVKNFEKEMRMRLGVDLFSVRTHLVQNLLQEVIGPETDIRTRTEVPSFGRYLDRTSVFLGKYIGSDLFLELLLQFRAEDPLSGTSREFGGVNIDSEIILEWKTPLFLLEWSFLPKNPDELFIFDNKFTFRWKFSY